MIALIAGNGRWRKQNGFTNCCKGQYIIKTGREKVGLVPTLPKVIMAPFFMLTYLYLKSTLQGKTVETLPLLDPRQ